MPTLNDIRNMDTDTFKQTLLSGFEAIPSQLKTFLTQLPLATFAIFAGCSAIYFADLVFWLIRLGTPLEDFLGLMPIKFLHGQIWRIFTYPLAHVSMFHLLFNMLALLSLSRTAEKRVGTLQYAYLLTVPFTLFPGIIYVLLTHFIFHSSDYHISTGTSGWVFALLTWECVRVDSVRSFFGLFNVSSKWYPVVILLVIEIIFPASSLIGHLTCMAAGYLYAFGWLNIVVPPLNFFGRIQNWTFMNRIAGHSRFVDINDAQDTGVFLPSFFTRSTASNTQNSPGASAGHTLGSSQPSRQNYVTIHDINDVREEQLLAKN
ncbi:Tryptase beta-2 [Dimargaris cristalligena]|uniref:rhomboid protease n=1 Tax=Dimargaris cristalligena TaxID=215637 RepID=A0A4V1J4N8_9FUNG|nr:Tryptase beta-2 [Dimargaris cristalligena]RKP36209.1 hypothetical protein BJ085DRAFT_27392 [Dimargaris cristalligena]|eukprot:RKP36209.1 hypothetical protein BJ085DRAFT_27392 [Dimargaris cristalligena]